MSSQTTIIPRQQVPALSVPTVGGEMWTLAEQSPESFTLIVFYRGLHCPICSRYLGDLDSKLGQFADKGVGAIAISSDTQERADKTQRDWKLGALPLGYDISLDSAREWGLFISTSKGKTSAGIEEPALFIEPGLFLVRPDNTLYCSSVQTMPFARPSFTEVLGAVDFVLANDYPARGQVIDHHAAAG
jgi:peroxiredoxin